MKDSESATAYVVWSGLFAIAAALQRRSYFQRGHTAVYPNLYTVLVGPSGNRKAEPLMIAQRLLRDLGINMIPETITRQALYRNLASSSDSWVDPESGLTSDHCSVCGIYEELAVFLGEHDAKFLADLTNWYDCRDKWMYQSKHQGTDEIFGVCFNMLGAMAPDWMPAVVPNSAIGGGFTSRILFIVESRKRATHADPDAIKVDRKLYERLLSDLHQIHAINGRFTFDEETRETYTDWYLQSDSGPPAIADPRFAGYNARRPTHALKIAMLMCAASTGDRVIRNAHFLAALRLLEAAEENMAAAFSKFSTAPLALQTDLVLGVIEGRGMVRKSELLRTLRRDLDVSSLKSIEETLLAQQAIEVDRADHRNPLYRIRVRREAVEEHWPGEAPDLTEYPDLEEES